MHNVMAATATAHYSHVMEDCLYGAEKVNYGDKAYANQTRREKTEADDIVIAWRVLLKACG